MKIKQYTKFLPILALTLLSVSSTTHAQDMKPAIDHSIVRQIQIYSETIEISALEYSKLKSAFSESKNHTALRNTLIKQIEDGKATLVSNQSIITGSRERGIIASIHESSHPKKDDSSAATKVKNTQGKPATAQTTSTKFQTKKRETALRIEAAFREDGYKTIELNLLNKKLVLNKGEFKLFRVYTPEIDGKPDSTKKLLHFVKGDILQVTR